MEGLASAPGPFIYLITDGAVLRKQGKLVSSLDSILADCSEFIAAVHFRENFDEPKDYDQCLLETIQLCKKRDIPLVIHASLEVALRAGVPAVQLNSTSSSTENLAKIKAAGMRFGFSAHSLEEVKLATSLGASHIFLSPIFKPISKPDDTRICLGVEQLRQACAANNSRIVALGGVTADNAASCQKAKAIGVAVIGEVFLSDNPVARVKRLADAWLESLRAQKPS